MPSIMTILVSLGLNFASAMPYPSQEVFSVSRDNKALMLKDLLDHQIIDINQ